MNNRAVEPCRPVTRIGRRVARTGVLSHRDPVQYRV